jgi:hypothetical protein
MSVSRTHRLRRWTKKCQNAKVGMRGEVTWNDVGYLGFDNCMHKAGERQAKTEAKTKGTSEEIGTENKTWLRNGLKSS